ncbi:MAG: hypothetical protein LC637_09050 [Xanthomonadaceae bacterium]|nr:hypothetical protein [Xanthomonadaceae bacterium]
MIILQPSVETIERGYAAWLGESSGPQTPEPAPADSEPAAHGEPHAQADESGLSGPQAAQVPPPGGFAMPDFVADAIRRQVAARPQRCVPEAGDLVLIWPPIETTGQQMDPQQAVVVALDERRDSVWSGWLVGSHVDYAGDRDLVLEDSLIEDGKDPAPIAGMVLCWDRVSLRLAGQVPVIHRLKAHALEAIRELARQTSPSHAEIEAAPGRMCLREINDHSYITGTPYLRDDPRAPYLRLARELARRVSQPEYDDQGRTREPGREPGA